MCGCTEKQKKRTNDTDEPEHPTVDHPTVDKGKTRESTTARPLISRSFSFKSFVVGGSFHLVSFRLVEGYFILRRENSLGGVLISRVFFPNKKANHAWFLLEASPTKPSKEARGRANGTSVV